MKHNSGKMTLVALVAVGAALAACGGSSGQSCGTGAGAMSLADAVSVAEKSEFAQEGPLSGIYGCNAGIWWTSYTKPGNPPTTYSLRITKSDNKASRVSTYEKASECPTCDTFTPPAPGACKFDSEPIGEKNSSTYRVKTGPLCEFPSVLQQLKMF